ncbi:30S ribosomal protein S17 [Candidatus Amesbacteria bacterium RIFCSPHIGHO2_02_FULL_47_9]|nr:MAG: 30S ribosomal protein S17 [Candidatus Amesbacteria bacterium RIFCSPHIGHO2_02_FULL_47_9]
MKTLTGIVTADKNLVTVTVSVHRLFTHPLYHKRIRRNKKYQVYNEIGAKKGDLVKMVQVRPISRNKYFKVTEVIKKHAAA